MGKQQLCVVVCSSGQANNNRIVALKGRDLFVCSHIGATNMDSLQKRKDAFERETIIDFLSESGTIERAAKAMGISRRYLHTLINKHGIVFVKGSVRS